MFTFLYFWYAFIISLNIGDFLLWLCTISARNRYVFICKRLRSKKYSLTNKMGNLEKIKTFVNDYLEVDGFFMLTLIKENSSDFVATEIVHRLYKEKFLNKYFKETMTTAIYDAIDTKQDEDSSNKIKRHLHLRSTIC